MKTPIAPSVGWGILNPDPQLSTETIALVQHMRNLPKGQRDALITKAVDRYLAVEMQFVEDQKPTRTEMVTCSSALLNVWGDIVGLP